MLLSIENVLDAHTSQAFLEELKQAEWENGVRTAGGQAITAKSNSQVVTNDPIGRNLGAKILQGLGQNPLFISAALPKKIFPPKFNDYRSGGHYGLHVDNALMHLPNGESMRTDLSATVFLSEPDSYEGGELVIETQFGVQEVKLEAGDMILYPSTSLHEVKPVTRGKRVCSFFWLESHVKDNHEREMLFDLDQSIQTLTKERSASDHEVKRLTSVYHNLLRRWS